MFSFPPAKAAVRKGFALRLGLAFAGVLASLAFAQEPSPTLSLSDAKRIAFERNWDLLAARSDVDLALAQRVVAREFPNPTISGLSSQIRVNGAGNATVRGNAFWQRSYDTVVAVSQLVEIGGKRADRRASAAAGIAGAEARLLDARRLLENAVVQAYVAAALARDRAEIMKRAAESLRREAQIAVKRLSVGDISKAELAQIEISAERIESDALGAEAEAKAARIAVDVLLGANPAAGNWSPSDSLERLAKESPPSRGHSSERSDLKAAKADVEKAEAELRLQKAQRVPDPTIVVQYEHQPPDLAETVGVGVSFSLPVWNRNSGAILAAGAGRNQAVQQQRRVEAKIAAEISAAEQSYQAAMERYRRQSNVIAPKSSAVLKTVELAYEKGGASLLELLAAERTDLETRLSAAQASADTATALAALCAALGSPSQP